MDEERLEKLAKQAKTAAVLTGIVAIVACIVLFIDNGIKVAILREAAKATDLLREAQHLAEGVRDGGAASAGSAGNAPGAGLNGSHGLDHDAAAGAAVGETRNGSAPSPADVAARLARRSQGHG